MSKWHSRTIRHPRYGRTACEICGQLVTTNARGRTSHLEAHVRRGEARVTKASIKLNGDLMRMGLEPLGLKYEKVESSS